MSRHFFQVARLVIIGAALLSSGHASGQTQDDLKVPQGVWRQLKSTAPESLLSQVKSVVAISFGPDGAWVAVFPPDGNSAPYGASVLKNVRSSGIGRSGFRAPGSAFFVVPSKPIGHLRLRTEIKLPDFDRMLAKAGVPQPALFIVEPGGLDRFLFSTPKGSQEHTESDAFLVTPRSQPATLTTVAQGSYGSMLMIFMGALGLAFPWILAFALRGPKARPTIAQTQREYDKGLAGYTCRAGAGLVIAAVALMFDERHTNESWHILFGDLSPLTPIGIALLLAPFALIPYTIRMARWPGQIRKPSAIALNAVQAVITALMWANLWIGVASVALLAIQRLDIDRRIAEECAAVFVVLVILRLSLPRPKSKPIEQGEFPDFQPLAERMGVKIQKTTLVRDGRIAAALLENGRLRVADSLVASGPEIAEAGVAIAFARVALKHDGRRGMAQIAAFFASCGFLVLIAIAIHLDWATFGFGLAMVALFAGVSRPLLLGSMFRKETFAEDAFAAKATSPEAVAQAILLRAESGDEPLRYKKIDQAVGLAPSPVQRLQALGVDDPRAV